MDIRLLPDIKALFGPDPQGVTGLVKINGEARKGDEAKKGDVDVNIHTI